MSRLLRYSRFWISTHAACGVLLGCFLLAGCAKDADNAGSQSGSLYQGQTIRVGVPSGWGFKGMWEFPLEEWGARTGGKAELVEVEMSDEQQPVLKPDSNLQLILFPWTRRGDVLAARQLQVLPQEALGESQLFWEDVFQGLREKQASIDAGPALMPLSSPVLVCYYRADLLEQAGLQPPETWEDYGVLLEKLPTWAPGLTAVEPWSPEFRATMFLSRAIPFVKHAGHYSVFFDVETGDPFIGTPGFVKALEVTQAAVKKLSPDIFQLDPLECRNQIISGQAALAIGLENGPAATRLSLGASAPVKSGETVKRKESIAIGFSRLPGSRQFFNATLKDWATVENDGVNHVTLTGFSGLCAGIPRGTKPEHASAAVNLLASLSLDSATLFPNGARGACRESQAQEASLWVGKELSASEAGKYIAVTAQSLRDRQQAAELPVLGRAEFRAALTTGLTECLEQGKLPAEVFQSVSAKWDKTLEKLGKQQVLYSYRAALGLIQRSEP